MDPFLCSYTVLKKWIFRSIICYIIENFIDSFKWTAILLKFLKILKNLSNLQFSEKKILTDNFVRWFWNFLNNNIVCNHISLPFAIDKQISYFFRYINLSLTNLTVLYSLFNFLKSFANWNEWNNLKNNQNLLSVQKQSSGGVL